jgi:hypothetical protein
MEMPKWYEDTSPEALEHFLELHRQMTPSQRGTRVFELNEMHEGIQRAGVRAMYPTASEEEVFLRVAARKLDRETMIKVYGWDPAEHP